MKYFMDTKFSEDGKTIDLISIGIVAEDGRELYLISNEFDEENCNDWVKENVLPRLHAPRRRVSRQHILVKILDFLNPKKYGKPEIWAYYADYDWVVFCQIFGRMIDLPKDYPMYCRDIKQLADFVGIKELPQQDASTEHNALADARCNKRSFYYLDRFIK